MLKTSFHTSCIEISEMSALVSSPSVLSPLSSPPPAFTLRLLYVARRKMTLQYFQSIIGEINFEVLFLFGSNSCYVKHI